MGNVLGDSRIFLQTCIDKHSKELNTLNSSRPNGRPPRENSSLKFNWKHFRDGELNDFYPLGSEMKKIARTFYTFSGITESHFRFVKTVTIFVGV